MIDSQSVKTIESYGISGYDAGKKIKSRKRHIITDTEGFFTALVYAADMQDRDGAPVVLLDAKDRFLWMRHIFADGDYAGQKLRGALRAFIDLTKNSRYDGFSQKVIQE